MTSSSDAQLGAFDQLNSILEKARSQADMSHGDNSDDPQPASHISLGELSDAMQERAFGLLILLLALPCALPFVYGLPQIVALPMLVLAFQMAQGRQSPWLPEAMRKRRLPIKGFTDVLSTSRKYAGWLETLAHPRLAFATTQSGQRVIGALLLVPCASILVPLPLTNTVPGVAVGIAAAGLIQRDGLFVVVGIIAGFVWVGLLVVGGPALVYVLINFLLGRGAG